MSTLLTVDRYIHRSPFALEGRGLTVVPTARHPNKAAFRAVLCQVDTASTRPPGGARGHCVLVTRQAALAAIPSLAGMGLNASGDFTGHQRTKKIGVIEGAELVGNDLQIYGFLYKRDFPRETAYIQQHQTLLGCSYEVCDVSVRDPNASVWVLDALTFTGASVLLRASAAYQDTSIAARRADQPHPALALCARVLRALARETLPQERTKTVNTLQETMTRLQALGGQIARLEAAQRSIPRAGGRGEAPQRRTMSAWTPQAPARQTMAADLLDAATREARRPFYPPGDPALYARWGECWWPKSQIPGWNQARMNVLDQQDLVAREAAMRQEMIALGLLQQGQYIEAGATPPVKKADVEHAIQAGASDEQVHTLARATGMTLREEMALVAGRP